MRTKSREGVEPALYACHAQPEFELPNIARQDCLRCQFRGFADCTKTIFIHGVAFNAVTAVHPARLPEQWVYWAAPP